MHALVQLMPVTQVRQFTFHLGPALNFVLIVSLFAFSLPALQGTLAFLGSHLSDLLGPTLCGGVTECHIVL